MAIGIASGVSPDPGPCTAIVGGFIVSELGAMLATFELVVFRGPTEGILVGLGIGVLLFLHRMAQTVGIESGRPAAEKDRTDPAIATDPDLAAIRISGALFFGAAAAGPTRAAGKGHRPCWPAIDECAVILRGVPTHHLAGSRSPGRSSPRSLHR